MRGDCTGFNEIRKRIWDELVHLHHGWQEYNALYGNSPERVQLLNRSARSFFGRLQRMMVRDVLLTISRLTDPARSAGRDNLVLLRLLEDPKLRCQSALKTFLEQEIESIRRDATSIHKHRNRYIAHLDHPTAIGASDDPLPPLTGEAITTLIGRMGAAYHRYASALYKTDVSFELDGLCSVGLLVAALERSEMWRQHELAESRRQFGIRPDEDGGA